MIREVLPDAVVENVIALATYTYHGEANFFSGKMLTVARVEIDMGVDAGDVFEYLKIDDNYVDSNPLAGVGGGAERNIRIKDNFGVSFLPARATIKVKKSASNTALCELRLYGIYHDNDR